MDDKLKSDIISCIEKSLRGEILSNMKTELAGTNEKGLGYVADFVYATVTGSGKDGENKEVHLAVKFGKRSKEFRENLTAMVDFYKRELFFYDTVLTAFQKFQLERNVSDTFSAFPKCYGTFLSEDIEALVLENLKTNGYELHIGVHTMNLQHLQLVLKNYAKLHALSFAMRDQDKVSFEKLVNDYESVIKKLISSMHIFNKSERIGMKLREFGRADLADKYEKETGNDKDGVLIKVLTDVPQESVIIHGDCHNNNFLFKYEDSNQHNPLRVAIIDWQVSELHSPVIDLSYFLYCAGSQAEFSQMDDILKFYYLHLTDFMQKLGSDARKIFPWNTLVEHWKKYSIYGFLMATSVSRIFFLTEDEFPVLEKLGSNSERKKNGGAKLKNEDLFKERLISIVDYYFNSKHT